MFEEVVRQLKGQYSHRQTYFVTPISSEEPGTVAAVDGGAAILWSNTVQSIGVVTAGYIMYDEHHLIVRHKVRSKAVLLAGEDIDTHRFDYELQHLKEVAPFCDCVLFDGALQDVPHTSFKQVIDALKGITTVMGISKKTRLDTLQRGIPDTEVLKSPGTWHYRISKNLCRSLNPLGDTYIARLHERGPSFRIDVRGVPLFERLAYFSRYLFCLGYPYPLMEIHKATTLRDKKDSYQNALQQSMIRQGLEKEYFSGIHYLERQKEEFHHVLDGLI
ncbi:MAG: hypothetical protein HXS43_13025 [Theionarchaea archaeon]|nr:hypothetical protein [Theionarchaea archaeon]